MSAGKVYLAGAGPGDPGLLTVRALHVLQNADLVMYDALVSDPVIALAGDRCEKRFVGKRGGDHVLTQSEIEDLMVREARAGKTVVRLKGGDPFVFGRGGEEAQRLRAEGIPFEIVPGVTSAIAAPAYAGIPLTHRDYNTSFTVVTGHEDPLKPFSTIDWAKLADPHATLVLLMAVSNLPQIVERLRAAGMPGELPAAIIQDGTCPSQITVTATLDTLATQAAAAGVGSPAVIVVGDVAALRGEIAWFDRSPLFGRRILLTRPRRQSESVAQALWERGAQAVIAPTIETGPPDDWSAARSVVDALQSFAWLVFSSRNGVDAFFGQLAQGGKDARYVGNVRVAAIGPKTADALSAYGIRCDLMPQRYVGEEVARALIGASAPGDRIAIYRAQEARDTLPAMLAGAGRTAVVAAAYKTSLLRDPEFAQKVADCDVLTFTSASTVAGFAANFGDADAAREAAAGKTIACIGPITAQAARTRGLHVDVESEDSTMEGLLAALERHASSTSRTPA